MMASYKLYDDTRFYYKQANVWDRWGGTGGYLWHTASSTSTAATYAIQSYANQAQHRIWNTAWHGTGTGMATNTATIAFEPEAQLTWAGEYDPVMYRTATGNGTWLTDEWLHDEAYANPYQEQVWQRWMVRENRADYDRMRNETFEERQARLDREQAAREEASRRHHENLVKAAGARERAQELLEMVLTEEEKLMRERTGRLTVRANDGKLYELDLGYGGVHGNITEIDEHGCVLARLCVQPKMWDDHGGLAIPREDGFVGQLLGLKFNAAEFVGKANRSQVRACRHAGVPILGQRAA